MVEQNIAAPAVAHDAQATQPDRVEGHVLSDNGPSPLLKQYLEQLGHAPGDQPMGVVHLKISESEGMSGDGHFGERIKHWDPKPEPVTQEKVEKVRSEMEKSVNELIPAHEQATLKQLRDGALDANPQAIQTAFEGLKDNPKLLHAMVKELNNEFKQEGNQVSFSVTDDNRLLLSADGHNGVEFGGKGPEAKSVTRGDDGYIHLAQEQGISSSTADVMKDVRQKASEDKYYLQLHDPYEPNLSELLSGGHILRSHEPSHLRPGEVWDRGIVKDESTSGITGHTSRLEQPSKYGKEDSYYNSNDYRDLIHQQAEQNDAVVKRLDFKHDDK